MTLPEKIPVRYSDDDAGYVSVRPVVRQTFRLAELAEMVVSVAGKDAERVQKIFRAGTVLYNGYRYWWESLNADLAAITALLAAFPDDNPNRSFIPEQASAILFESSGGTQRSLVELKREEAAEKKLFAKVSPWDVLLAITNEFPPRYEKYQHGRRADLFRSALPYERAQQLLGGLLDAAPRSLRQRWSTLRPPSALTFVCPR